MPAVLVPVDGARNALGAVRHAIAAHRRGAAIEVHLLNVQPRLWRHAARFVARAEEICRAAKRLGVDRIVIGTARKNSLTRMIEDSLTQRVLETTPVPLEVVVGDAVSKWERWGLPAGVLALGGLLVLAID